MLIVNNVLNSTFFYGISPPKSFVQIEELTPKLEDAHKYLKEWSVKIRKFPRRPFFRKQDALSCMSLNSVELAKTLASEINEDYLTGKRIIKPDELLEKSITVISKLQTGESQFVDKNQSVNYGCLPITANELLFSDLPKIVDATCPQNFSDELILLTRKLYDEVKGEYFNGSDIFLD